MPRQVALLRGVNLGKRQVVMSDLRAVLEAAGYGDVSTLLASGNVVLDAKEKGAKLEAALERVIADGLGLKTDVFVRTAAELDAVIAANPFDAFAKKQPNFLVVTFMRATASKAELRRLRRSATAGEEAAVQGKHCLLTSSFPRARRPSAEDVRARHRAQLEHVCKPAAAARGE
ncbi:MAG: DUF1697 domain-containing protein [Hyphomonadaceae bacterium]